MLKLGVQHPCWLFKGRQTSVRFKLTPPVIHLRGLRLLLGGNGVEVGVRVEVLDLDRVSVSVLVPVIVCVKVMDDVMVLDLVYVPVLEIDFVGKEVNVGVPDGVLVGTDVAV